MERTNTNLNDSGILLQMSWWTVFKDSGHPVFRASSGVGSGVLEKEGWTMHDSFQR